MACLFLHHSGWRNIQLHPRMLCKVGQQPSPVQWPLTKPSHCQSPKRSVLLPPLHSFASCLLHEHWGPSERTWEGLANIAQPCFSRTSAKGSPALIAKSTWGLLGGKHPACKALKKATVWDVPTLRYLSFPCTGASIPLDCFTNALFNFNWFSFWSGTVEISKHTEPTKSSFFKPTAISLHPLDQTSSTPSICPPRFEGWVRTWSGFSSMSQAKPASFKMLVMVSIFLSIGMCKEVRHSLTLCCTSGAMPAAMASVMAFGV